MKRLFTCRPPALSLVEVLVVLGIIALLVGLAFPSYGAYRRRTAVNTSIEMVGSVVSRAREEARASGAPLPSLLKQTGLPASPTQVSSEGRELSVRLSKRLRPNGELQVLSQRPFGQATGLELQFSEWGVYDFRDEAAITGVFVDILVTEGSSETVLASIAADLNGEFLFAGTASAAELGLEAGGYQRRLLVQHRGNVSLDRR